MSDDFVVHHITMGGGKVLCGPVTQEEALRVVGPLINKLTKDGETWHKYKDPTSYHAWRSSEWHYILIKRLP
jgi:hypothetical protein